MTNQPPYFYATDLEWTGERQGKISAPNLPTLTVATPPEFHGHEGVWSPEHFFVGAVNACFMTTFLAIAELSKLRFVAFRSHAEGKLEKIEGQGFQITALELRPQLVIAEERDRERAERLLEKAERHCLISNSIKSSVTLKADVRIGDPMQQAA